MNDVKFNNEWAVNSEWSNASGKAMGGGTKVQTPKDLIIEAIRQFTMQYTYNSVIIFNNNLHGKLSEKSTGTQAWSKIYPILLQGRKGLGPSLMSDYAKAISAIYDGGSLNW